MSIPYDFGLVNLEQDSVTVIGVDTAWKTMLVEGGMFSVKGYSIPIRTVPDDNTIILAYAYPGVDEFEVPYAIGTENSIAGDIVWMNDRLAEVLRKLSLAGIHPIGSGTLTQRDALDPQPPEGEFWVEANIGESPDLFFWRKIESGWEGPYPLRGAANQGLPGSAEVVGTSSSSLLVEEATKVFVVNEPNRGWGLGTRLKASSSADLAIWMEGVVSSYVDDEVTVEIDLISGSETVDDWVLVISGSRGAPSTVPGPQGPQGEAFQPDEVVEFIAGRDAFDESPKNFAVLVESDSTNDDLPTLYFKLSNATADWSEGFTFIGGGGGDGEVQSIVAGPGIAVDDTDPANPVVSSTVIGNFNWQGNWSAIVEYVSGDWVSHNGTTWFASIDNDNSEPGTNSDWEQVSSFDGGPVSKPIILPPSITSAASLNIDDGTAPTSPEEGDIWGNGGKLYRYIDGVTREIGSGREVLTANRTYYVRTNGNNANTGLANNSGGAFLTLARAMQAVGRIDFNGWTVTVQIADGTYTAGCTIPICVGMVNAGSLIIQGNAANDSAVSIDVTSQNCFTLQEGAMAQIRFLKVKTTTGGSCIQASTGARLRFSNIVFDTCAAYHLIVNSGSLVTVVGPYTIVGSAQFHWLANQGGMISCFGRTITLTGTPSFTTFVAAWSLSAIDARTSTFTGSATGKRYDATLNSVIDTGTANTSFLPGNASGTTATGGQYG